MITSKNEVKTMTKHISFDCKCKFNSTTCNLNQKWNNKTCQRECKNYCTCKKDCSWNPSIGSCEDIKYLKSIADTSVMACDEIILFANICQNVDVLTLYTNIKHNIDALTLYKHGKKNNFKTFVLKVARVIISMTIKVEDFDTDNILIDEKSHENILIYGISYKTSIKGKPSRIRLDKIDGFIRIYDGTGYLKLFDSEKFAAIYNKIRYLLYLKSDITYVFSHYYEEIKVGSIPIEKPLALHNVIILIK